MISLKTLSNATEQEVFDWVTSKLLKQAQPSKKGQECRYNYKGLRCAGGWLITRKEYDPSMEGRSWLSLVTDFSIPDTHSELIYALQQIHDNKPVDTWEKYFIEIAKSRGLNYEIR
jgi:hypothetical protein